MPRLVITLYDEDSEPRATYNRNFVPWKLLKRAVRLAKTLDKDDLTEENVDDLAALIVETFGNKFTVEELNESADIGEMMTVLESIMATAGKSSPNPPPRDQG